MALVAPAKRPMVFEYEDYRDYLRDIYAFHKERSRHFSFRNFSRRAGFSSPNFLKLVIERKRNLSDESIPKFAIALRLSKAESEFFSHLVHFNQARNLSERAEHAELLTRSKGFQKVYPLKQAEYSYYACWYYIPIRELVAIADFQEDHQWIASHIFPAISPEDAAKALKDLETLGLLVRDSDGRLHQATRTVTTENEVVSASISSYHKEMLRKAADSIDQVPRTEREISAACIPASRETAIKIKNLIQNFRDELLAIAAEDQSPETVYQINMQLFPLSVWQDKKEGPK